VLSASCRGDTYDLARVRARADDMSRRLLEAYYATDAHGEESRLADILAEYDDLADPGLVRYVATERAAERDPRRRKQLDYLYYDIVGTIIWQDLASIQDQITDIESGGVLTVGDEEIAYRDIGIRLYNETESALREAYYMSMGEFDVEHTNPLRNEMVELTRDGLGEHGFRDLDEFEAARRGVDHDELEATVVEFLDETRGIYRALTGDAALDIFGVAVTDVPDYDRGRLFRGAEFDQYFPAEDAVPLLSRTLLAVGIDLDELPMIHIDDEDRPEKEPRAASYSIVPGEDVRILVKPVGGLYDYESLFHEMGHALHDSYVRVDEYEFTRLGDYGTTETHAYLLEQLFSDPTFLEANGFTPGPEVARALLKNQLLGELGSARYYGALFRYERLLHRGGLTDEELVAAYRSLMEDYRLVPLEHPEFGYLSSDEGFYGVNYLEAWFLAAQIRSVLVERFGDRWWSTVEAGDFLKDLWGYGSELPPDEIARLIGFDGLDSSYFTSEIKAAYRAYR
jgi:oligoendopeptidase F